MEGAPLLEVSGLTAAYSRGLSSRPDFIAVRDVSFAVSQGETLGLIGETGSGKSTALNAVAGLIKHTRGNISFKGFDVTSSRNKPSFRREVSMLFQSPAVNPKMKVLDIVAEPIRNFQKLNRAEEQRRVGELLEMVGLTASRMDSYPREFSGGMLQRVAIARALALRPSLLLADEPVSSLDACARALVLDLLRSLCKELSLACVFVTHDLGVARHMCDNLCIMRQGEIVERGSAAAIFDNPSHPYTKLLIASILPVIVKEGEIPCSE